MNLWLLPKLDRDDIERIVGQLADDAQTFIEEDLADEREKATDYYHGRLFGDEEEGRSKVVSTVVRDIALRMEPPLMRVFHGPEHPVEFRPRVKPGFDAQQLSTLKAQAKQRTDYVSHIYNEDNPGFENTQDVIRDALVRKIGFMRWWWDTSRVVEEQEYRNLTDEQIAQLESDNPPGVEVTTEIITVNDDETSNVRVKIVDTSGRVRVESGPPEEIIWNRNATAFREGAFRLIGHDRDVTVSDLVALGYDEDEVLEQAGDDSDVGQDDQVRARRFDDQHMPDENTEATSLQKVRFLEAYVFLDKDDDGQATLNKVDMVGKGRKLLQRTPPGQDEPEDPVIGVSHLQIAAFHFNREPHTVAGLSVYDMGKDLQRIDSQILRGTLDSLTNTLYPRVAFHDQRVSVADMMSKELGAPIRTQGPPSNVLQEFRQSFVGGDTLPMRENIARTAEERFGVTRASNGLNGADLQSSTDTAVRRTFGAREERIELVARGLANGFKAVFAGIDQTVIENQEAARVIELRGQYVEVNPKAWNAGMDVRINVGLGAGLIEDRINTLEGIAAKQEQVVSMLGPSNQISHIGQLVNTYRRAVELRGFSNPDEFFNEISDQDIQAMRQAEANQPDEPQDPVALEQAKAETIRNQTAQTKAAEDIKLQQAQLELDRNKALLEDDRARDKAASDMALELIKLEAETGKEIDKARIDATTKIIRANMESETRQAVAAIQTSGSNEQAN